MLVWFLNELGIIFSEVWENYILFLCLTELKLFQNFLNNDKYFYKVSNIIWNQTHNIYFFIILIKKLMEIYK